MKTLDVPTSSIMDVRRAPSKIFKKARETGNPVYVFNRGVAEGVIMTAEQYALLFGALETLRELQFDSEVAKRLADTEVKTFSDINVRGAKSKAIETVDELDGWE